MNKEYLLNTATQLTQVSQTSVEEFASKRDYLVSTMNQKNAGTPRRFNHGRRIEY
ncbi:MAG TPA: hypothetical protein PLS94_13465 [Prolixibacteraceae bacterium]|nr:hypothetical protein [Prolixibacteraceae bacterium]HPR61425.1 hypothetical protein [Prolixibacteraceae bacterium]